MDQGVADPGAGSTALLFQLLLMVILIIVNAFFAAFFIYRHLWIDFYLCSVL